MAAAATTRTIDTVVVHPLVLLSCTDHYNRVARDTQNRRVVGLLLGESFKGRVDVTNSFAVVRGRAAPSRARRVAAAQLGARPVALPSRAPLPGRRAGAPTAATSKHARQRAALAAYHLTSPIAPAFLPRARRRSPLAAAAFRGGCARPDHLLP
jgi:hypothetical protein